MASGEYRRPQSDSGVSFRCLRLKCELYLNVCLSISISLCPAHRLFNSFSTLRSTKITFPLSLSLSLSLSFIMQSANLSNRLQIDKLSTAISVFVSPNSSSSLWAPHAFKATLQMLCFCFIFYSLFETCLTTRTTALLIPCLVYGIRTTSTQHIQLLIGKSIDQLCRQRGATSLTVSELGSSYEIFS